MNIRISEATPKASPFMERLDSGITDESPFGSSLTTPVDEDVELFSGIGARLLGEDSVEIGGNAGYKTEFLRKGEFESSLFHRKKSSLCDVDDIRPGITPSPTMSELYQRANDIRLEGEGQRGAERLEHSTPDRHTNDPVQSEAEQTQLLLSPEPEEYVYRFEPEIGELYDVHSDDGDEDFRLGTLQLGEQQPDLCAYNNEEHFSQLPFALNSANVEKGLAVDLDALEPTFPILTLKTLLPTLLRVAFFLPWCILVGGIILLSPGHLDLVAFRPGYIQPSPSPGIRRFKHWAETGREFVGIFLGFVASIWWMFPWFGLLVVTGVLAQMFYVWSDFTVDERRGVKLGKDDRESVWIVLKGYRLSVRDGRGGWYVATCTEASEEEDEDEAM